ncbi:transglutaminase family protein [Jeongeupia sp. USM3]|uniref:transglutaminase-like domain-containing protein n=1 Tax=Jeongeupia sp. USM3 TaxID=1906741 RepID=UPI00089DFD03|nr:transglutaminase-like domain-containing protein [Jeongeupia sp. USM3]AOX99677.1 hypothetical protein BJP62_03925 [Jeongeupia sp. USM3]
MNRRHCFKLGVTFVGGLLLAPFGMSALPTSTTVRRQLRLSVVLTNPLNEPLQDQVLWLYVPAAETATQTLQGLSVSMAHEVLTDELGHRFVKLSLPQLAPLASKTVSIAADLDMRVEPLAALLAQPSSWLQDERYIEVRDARMQAKAAELKRDTALATGRAIYDWVRQSMHYAGYIADDLGALYALTQHRGDCTEYAYLAAALARACSIPARMVGGYVSDRNFVPRPEEYHNWAELYIDGAWRLLDAQKENWLAPADQYIAFRFYRDKVINPVGLAHRFLVQGAMQVRA